MKSILGSLAGALFICASLLAPAHGTMVIRDNPGGNITNFISFFHDVRAMKEPVVVDGECDSACTLMTGLLPASQVCVTPAAVFRFHSAFWAGPNGENLGFSKPGTALLWRTYPAKVRKLIRKEGWNGHTPHPSLISIKGTQLYGLCK